MIDKTLGPNFNTCQMYLNQIRFLLIFLFSLNAHAGKEVGNGGHVWLCYDPQAKLEKITSADMDYFREYLHLKTNLCLEENLDDCDKYNDHLKLLESEVSPPIEQFKALLEFYRVVSPQIYNSLQSHFEFVLKTLHFTTLEGKTYDFYKFAPTHTDVIKSPSTVISKISPLWPAKPKCSGRLALKNIAIYYANPVRIEINSLLWNSPLMSNSDRFFVLVHEAMYNYYRWSPYYVPQNNYPAALMTSHLLGLTTIENKEAIFKPFFHVLPF